ncbi:acyl-CoA synthetase (AMP-forming)/AMP-acid ligase II [Haloactinospora alba]|uniref:Acyl-CoA synthetase (AMP-forming)/AMP-acid ligase II n=1 Tax=Haloactinospora alba TaxID=405555 RepID=A0A543N754_9ACTN|nr:SDR family NAD(P)-dependent oxidoreductase [Haloactinospora alba]TQN27627.1 acyl-CoA synthetase (AMP-forming)/AMP-acid ligase II [Haloactinospora alba]
MTGHDAPRRADLEKKILTVDTVTECVALTRPDDRNGLLTVYVVPAPNADLLRLRRRVSAALIGAGSTAVVPLRRIPRSGDGSPDTEALLALPVLTPARIRDYEEELTAALPAAAPRVELRPVPEEPRRFLPHDRDAPPETAAEGRHGTSDPGPLPAAELDGGELRLEDGDPRTVTEALLSAPRRSPEAGVRVVTAERDSHTRPRTLLDRARRVLGGLRERGLGPGSRAVLQSDDLEEYFPALWACLLGGIQCATVASPPSYGPDAPALEGLLDVHQQLGSPPVITSSAGAAALSGALATQPRGAEVDVAPVPELERSEPSDAVHRAEPGEVAVLQLSSGSTGRPKIIPITHRAIVHMAVTARSHNRISAGDVTFNWLPMDHVVPVVMFHLRDTVLGCAGVHAPTDHVAQDPLRWLDIMERYRVNHSWSPNFGYKMLTDALDAAPERHWDLSSVRTLLNGGEQCTMPVVRAVLERTARFGIHPGNMVFAWGMAETATGVVYKFVSERASSVTVEPASLDGAVRTVPETAGDDGVEFATMGPPVPGVRIRVVGDDGRVLPERTVGRVRIRADRVTPGYLDAPETNAAAFSGDGWFDTGDLAFAVDGELVVTGRAKEQIVINGANYYCHDIEDACGGVEGVSNGFVAACSLPDDATGSASLGVFYVPDTSSPLDASEVRSRLRAVVAERFRLAAARLVPLHRSEFPRTSSGKIQRSELVRRTREGEFDSSLPGTDPTFPECAYRPEWVPVEPVPDPLPSGPRIVVADGHGLADHLTPDSTTVTVRAGESFAETPEGYVVDPASPSDWDRLRNDLHTSGFRWGTLLYLPSYLPAPAPHCGDAELDRAMNRCGELLLTTVRELLPLASGEGARVVTASRQLRPVTGKEGVCYPAAQTAAVSSLLTAETPGVETRHVDLPGGTAADDAAAFESALGHRSGDGGETVWRDGRPHVLSLRPGVEDAPARDALRRGGWYLVTGGAGGIGSVLLEDLAQRYRTRFLVVSRNVAEGERGAVRHRAADVCDPEELRRVVAETERKWGGSPAGAVHLAESGYRFRLLAEETGESWREALRAKTRGTRNVAALLRERPGSHLVVFSSLLGFSPSVGFGGYAAASAAADALCAHLAAHTDLSVHSVLWGAWQDVGVNQGNPYESAIRQRGLLSLSPQQGALLTRLVLRQDAGTHLVGLNGAAPPVRRLVQGTEHLPLERAVVLADPDAFPDGPPAVTDAVGAHHPPVLVRQRDGDGHGGQPSGTAPADPETLRRVEEVFRGLLATDPDTERGFHELGLGSLQILQAHARLESALDMPIPQTALFEHPTVTALAGYLSGLRHSSPAQGEV